MHNLSRRKPRILLLVDHDRWVFDNTAHEIARLLRHDFRFEIRRVHAAPKLDPKRYDLIYVFFWGETYHQRFGFEAARTIKGVASHRWEDETIYGRCTPPQMVGRYLEDAGTVICTSRRLTDAIRPLRGRVFCASNGIDLAKFRKLRERSGRLTIGWAGNIKDCGKGINDIVKPACRKRFRLLLAPGNVPHHAMNDFYNRCDVIAIASVNEGQPLPLLEAMAAGCFPVCTPVGVVPELVRSGENGLVVCDRSVESFRAAFEWCEAHVDRVRNAGTENADFIRRERDWNVMAGHFEKIFWDTVNYAERPRFRNDDVSADTSLVRFRQFCNIFWKNGIQQLHGITLRGRTNSHFSFEADSVEYAGFPSLANLPNQKIRQLSNDFRFEQRHDLVEFLRESPDEIALHGLYHTDLSTMSSSDQTRDIKEGLELLNKLFPKKQVRYFIPPFNRTSADTYRVAAEFGLKILATQAVHLEERLNDLVVEPRTWYRYHHHRFYPESTFTYYSLSLDALDAALRKNAGRIYREM